MRLCTVFARFGSADFIMEPEIFAQLKKYFQAGGNPEQVIELLSKNYLAVAQMANLMAEWLILAGAEINDVQQQVTGDKCRCREGEHAFTVVALVSGGESPSRYDPEDVRPEEGGRHLPGGGRDPIVAGGADRVPHVALPHLQAGRGLPGLPHAQLHYQADLRRRLPGRDHLHLDGGAANRGILAYPQDVRQHLPQLGRGGAAEEHGRVRQDGLPRPAHLCLRTGEISEKRLRLRFAFIRPPLTC